MIRWIYLILLIFSSCNRPMETEVAQHKPDFCRIPFVQYDGGNIPMVEVEIQGHKYSMILDLGSSADLELVSPWDHQVLDKEFLGTITRRGLRAKSYDIPIYHLKGAYIGEIYVRDLPLGVSSVRMALDGCFSVDGDTELKQGTVGWSLFQNVQLLIDASRDQAAVMRNLEGLAENGYYLDQFVCVPLLLDRDLVEFEAEVNGKVWRCTLDTGCTRNYYPLIKRNNKNLDEIFEKPREKALVSLHIAGCDMGLVEMTNNVFDPTLGMQVILGMQFIQDHTIVVDFPGKMLYFRKNNMEK